MTSGYKHVNRRALYGADDFWALTLPEPNTGCVLWLGNHNAAGYGRFGMEPSPSAKRGLKNRLAHRYSYATFRGPIPESLCVLHRCDTPACVNPDHLFLGTHADNVSDKEKKGRGTGGARQRATTHCPAGHPYDSENTYPIQGKVGRSCRACARIGWHRRKSERAA